MKNPNLPYQTLHAHTIQSDGEYTYGEVLELCKENKIGVVAFTDHDIVPNDSDLAELDRLKNHAVKYVVGIELTVIVSQTVAERHTVHIVGLFIDPFDSKLVSHTQSLADARTERVKHAIVKLRDLGFTISFDELIREYKGRSVGRPQIAKVLLKNSENIERLDQIEKEFYQHPEIKNFETIRLRLQGSDNWDKLFMLLFSGKSHIPGVILPVQGALNLKESASLIHNAGGIVVLAHWTFNKDNFTSEEVEKSCQAGIFDGLETTYGFGKVGNLREEIEADRQFLKQLVERYNMLCGGGGDFHTKDEFSLMKIEKKFAAETKGMVEAILAKKNVNLTWSSLKQ